MSNFYIRIVNEEPEEDNGLWFKLETNDERELDEFFVLKRHDYDNLVQQFNLCTERLKDSEILQDAVNSLIADSDFIANVSNNSFNVVNQSNQNLKYGYGDIKTLFDTKLDIDDYSVDSNLNSSSTNPVRNSVVTNALNTKANTEDVSTSIQGIKNSLSGKANSSHNHSSWSYMKLGDYGSLRYNSNLRIALFAYQRDNYKISKTGNFVTLHSSIIPNGYRPVISAYLDFHNYHLGGIVDTNGALQVRAEVTGSYTLACRGWWIY